MGITITLILAIVSLIYNIIKKNHIGANILAISVLVIISGFTVCFGEYTELYIVNTIHTALTLILAVLSILFVVKDIKTIKITKSLSLIAIILTYICVNFLAKPSYVVNFTVYDELKKAIIITMSITLLAILEINLFINLISNSQNIIDKEKTNEVKI